MPKAVAMATWIACTWIHPRAVPFGSVREGADFFFPQTPTDSADGIARTRYRKLRRGYYTYASGNAPWGREGDRFRTGRGSAVVVIPC